MCHTECSDGADRVPSHSSLLLQIMKIRLNAVLTGKVAPLGASGIVSGIDMNSVVGKRIVERNGLVGVSRVIETSRRP